MKSQIQSINIDDTYNGIPWIPSANTQMHGMEGKLFLIIGFLGPSVSAENGNLKLGFHGLINNTRGAFMPEQKLVS